jgi:hypothetical protein
MVWTLRRRPDKATDCWDGQTYRWAFACRVAACWTGLRKPNSCSEDQRSRKQMAVTLPIFRTQYSRVIAPMAHDFKVGDHVEWNSEAGRIRGTMKKRITAEITFKGYKVHASKESRSI